jgi:hypothetical protein
MSAGVPPVAMVAVMDDLEQETEAARAVMPESEDVKKLDQFIAQFKGVGVVRRVPRSLAAPTDQVTEADVI